MPLPDLSALCNVNLTAPRPCITMPGGAEICTIFPDARIPDPSEMVNQLFAMLSAALAPLAPIFNIIEVLVAIVACIKAIQKAIASFPPRPDKLLACFPRLARAIGKVLAMLPPLSIPVLIGNFLDALIALLAGIRNQLLAIIKKTLKILVAQTTASSIGSAGLLAVVDCAQADLDAFEANMADNAKPIGKMIQFINTLMELAGLDPLPPVSVNPNHDAAAAVAPIDDTVKVLKALRLAFP